MNHPISLYVHKATLKKTASNTAVTGKDTEVLLNVNVSREAAVSLIFTLAVDLPPG